MNLTHGLRRQPRHMPNLNIYVGTKTDNYLAARWVMSEARKLGHVITHDWTQQVEEVGDAIEQNIPLKDQRRFAQNDRMGVWRADLVIVLAYPRICGTLVEFGMALAWNKPVWLVGEPTQSTIFFAEENVIRLADIPAAIEGLKVQSHRA